MEPEFAQPACLPSSPPRTPALRAPESEVAVQGFVTTIIAIITHIPIMTILTLVTITIIAIITNIPIMTSLTLVNYYYSSFYYRV